MEKPDSDILVWITFWQTDFQQEIMVSKGNELWSIILQQTIFVFLVTVQYTDPARVCTWMCVSLVTRYRLSIFFHFTGQTMCFPLVCMCKTTDYAAEALKLYFAEHE